MARPNVVMEDAANVCDPRLLLGPLPVEAAAAAPPLALPVASGPRCGVHLLIHWDQRHSLPQDFVPDELKKNSVDLVRVEKRFELAGRHLPGTKLALDAPPSSEFATHFLHQVV